uniref:Ribosomal protein S1 n=1 Tax=Cryptopleura ramosa TaxID=131094 RepID=A0A4D6WPH7_9FLOR|nr:ribosomal protein S1 [Cryptopleura ramosa]
MLKKYNYNLHQGDIVAGTIIYQEFNGFLVNIGDNMAGYLPQEEIGLKDIINNTKLNYFINTTREFFLVTHKPKLKQSILSIKRLEYIRGWKRIKQYQNENIIFNLKVKYINKGGIITYLDNIQGFIPKSQIYLSNHQIKFDEQYIKCKLITANEQKNQLILSNKSALLYLSKHKFRLGELIYGQVKKIKPYGLFIEIYGIIALLHISEITYKYINNIYHFFHIGKLIKVKIIHIDMKQGRLSVSRRYNIQ